MVLTHFDSSPGNKKNGTGMASIRPGEVLAIVSITICKAGSTYGRILCGMLYVCMYLYVLYHNIIIILYHINGTIIIIIYHINGTINGNISYIS